MTTFQKASLLKSMQRMDWEMRLRHYPAVMEADDREVPAPEPQDAEAYFLAEQCPADSNFR